MSYDDDNPDVYFNPPDDQLLIIELMKIEEKNLPDLVPWFENESDQYTEINSQDTEYPYDQ